MLWSDVGRAAARPRAAPSPALAADQAQLARAADVRFAFAGRALLTMPPWRRDVRTSQVPAGDASPCSSFNHGSSGDFDMGLVL